MKSNRFLAILSISVLGIAGPALAADAEAGKAKAKSCAGCHGAAGEGKGKTGGPIAGMDPKKFAEAMEEYQSGKRKHGGMKMATAKLGKDDIENLAAYYASLKK
jgi:cytochrome c553